MIVVKRLLPVVLLFFAMPLAEFSSVEDVAEEQKKISVVDPEYTDDEQPYCHNVDIRNNLERLKKIENCTVITGFLQLVLIERIPQEEFAKYTFKNLR